MNLTMIRAKVKTERVADAETAVTKMFAALNEEQPDGIRYASCKLADGETFVALLELKEGIEDPLPTLPAFREFQAGLGDWLAEPPTFEQLTVVGSYNLFGTHAAAT